MLGSCMSLCSGDSLPSLTKRLLDAGVTEQELSAKNSSLDSLELLIFSSEGAVRPMSPIAAAMWAIRFAGRMGELVLF